MAGDFKNITAVSGISGFPWSFGSPSAVTASTNQSQGQQQLSANTWYKINTGNANDVCTMPSSPSSGDWVWVDNRGGGETLQLYPDTGDNFYGLAANASTTVADGVNLLWIYDGSEWVSRG